MLYALHQFKSRVLVFLDSIAVREQYSYSYMVVRVWRGVYIYIYICMYVCMYVCMRAHMSARVDIRACRHTSPPVFFLIFDMHGAEAGGKE